jgi:hypothetical protein
MAPATTYAPAGEEAFYRSLTRGVDGSRALERRPVAGERRRLGSVFPFSGLAFWRGAFGEHSRPLGASLRVCLVTRMTAIQLDSDSAGHYNVRHAIDSA